MRQVSLDSFRDVLYDEHDALQASPKDPLVLRQETGEGVLARTGTSSRCRQSNDTASTTAATLVLALRVVRQPAGAQRACRSTYLKEGRALRIETVINKPSDIGVKSRLEHLPELVDKARGVNRRLLEIERAGQSCAIGSALFERIHQPFVCEGQRTGALRFGDQRAMALAGALCLMVHAVTGFTNASLRGLVAGLLRRDYSTNQMSYDLRRLRLHGLIERIPHTNTYAVTPDGIRVAVFFTKLDRRLLHPLLAADRPPGPLEVRRALTTIDKAVTDYVKGARLGTAAA